MAEGITLKRIIDMDEAAELTSSDYALVDSATGGPKKFALGNELSSLKEDLDAIQIEGYARSDTSMIGTVYESTMVGGSGRLISISGWYAFRVYVEQGQEVFITGTGSPLYVVKDSTDTNVLRYKVTESSEDITDYSYTATENCYLYVNRKNHIPVVKSSLVSNSFIKNTNGITPEDDGSYNVGTAIVNNIMLSRGGNELFNFNGMYDAQNNMFKPTNDDITPIYIGSVGYVGANHGYYYGYKITTTATLDTTDIGATATDSGDTWVIIQTSPNVVIICYNSNTWMKMKEKSVPASLTFGSKTVSISASSLVQIYPSIKNKQQTVLNNADGEMKIAETYDIYNIGQAIDALIANVGNNDNDSLAQEGDSIYTIRNVYDIQKNGSVTVYQNLRQNSSTPRLAWYGGVQSIGFNESDETYVALPSTATSLQVGSGNVNFTTDMWVDEDTPPKMFIQANHGATNSTRAMMLVYMLDRDTFTTQAGQYASSKKMYPYLTQPVAYDVKTYENISLRIPVLIGNEFTDIDFAGYARIYDDYYLCIYGNKAFSGCVQLPSALRYKKVEKVDGDITVNNTVVIDTINLDITVGQWAILKFTD